MADNIFYYLTKLIHHLNSSLKTIFPLDLFFKDTALPYCQSNSSSFIHEQFLPGKGSSIYALWIATMIILCGVLFILIVILFLNTRIFYFLTFLFLLFYWTQFKVYFQSFKLFWFYFIGDFPYLLVIICIVTIILLIL